MKPTVKLTKKSALPAFRRSLQQVTRSEVYVGVPASANTRPEAGIGNADLMFILTNGSALQGIPATPIIEAAISKPETKALIGKQLGLAAKEILDNNAEAAHTHLDLAGQIGANASKRIFVDNDWPANAPSTIARKGSSRRNIDTGELRRAITWIVKEK